MKSVLKLTGVSFIFIVFFMVGAMANTAATKFGEFEVAQAQDKMMVNGTEVETYVITYNDLEMPIYVGVYKDKKCEHYIVRTDSFEIEYRCKNGRFGVTYVDKDYATVNVEAVQKKLNRENFLYQKMIFKGEKTESYKLNLIASYLPELYNAG